MDTKINDWNILYKANEKFYLMFKSIHNKKAYALLCKHTFNFLTPKKLLDSQIFNMKYQSPYNIPHIAGKLRYYRYKHCLLQKEVAKKIGINESTYISYEANIRDYYPIDIIEKIAKLYNVNVTDLLDEYNLFLYNGQGTKLKILRQQLGITQKQLAQRLNVHIKTISKWEKDMTRISKSFYRKIFIDRCF